MAVKFKGGVVIGADSRTSLGAYVSNRVSDKLTRLHDRIYCCRSGSAADTQAVADIVEYNLDLHSLKLGKNPEVEFAAKIVRNICYEYRKQLTAGMIVAGWDDISEGSVYSIPLGGSLHNQSFTIGGSGSAFIYGYCDANYKEEMTREECIDFVKKSVSLAMSRDGSSGGIVRIGIITKEGVERLAFDEKDLKMIVY
eukprot:GHVP01002917.1.p1 GENE.GHVP01002917.1~~GHVP01002917.1.p1  ORF type:complete len:213 (+),score=39.96 GHVP01002917.1:51-641(+)